MKYARYGVNLSYQLYFVRESMDKDVAEEKPKN